MLTQGASYSELAAEFLYFYFLGPLSADNSHGLSNDSVWNRFLKPYQEAEM